MKKRIDKYTIIIIISSIALIAWFVYLFVSYKHFVGFTPKKSDNSKESIVDTIDWFNARWTTPYLDAYQYKGEELDHLDRSIFSDVMELPYGIYKDINTNEIIMNLDDVFPFVDFDANPSLAKDGQENYIDKDYIDLYYGDYGHHATELFLNYFFNFDKVDRIVIGGRTLKFDHYDTADAPIESWEVFLDETGEEQHYDDRIEFLTCIYNPDLPIADRRYIAYMEEIEPTSTVIYLVEAHKDEDISKINSTTKIENPIIKYLKNNPFLIVCGVIFIISILGIIIFYKKKKDEDKEYEILKERGKTATAEDFRK